jgi:hypothetical protein
MWHTQTITKVPVRTYRCRILSWRSYICTQMSTWTNVHQRARAHTCPKSGTRTHMPKVRHVHTHTVYFCDIVRYFCHGHRRNETKVQSGERTFSFYLLKCHQQNKKYQQQYDLEAYKGYSTPNKDNFPQWQKGKRLPKYDSKSETAIDSCPWLRTIPGQNIETQKHRKQNIKYPPKSHPDQTRHKKALYGQGVTVGARNTSISLHRNNIC